MRRARDVAVLAAVSARGEGLARWRRGKAGYRLTEARLGCGLSASTASGGGYKAASGDTRVALQRQPRWLCTARLGCGEARQN